jgi:hypothetical protein
MMIIVIMSYNMGDVPIAGGESPLEQGRGQAGRFLVQLLIGALLLNGGRRRLEKGHGQLVGELYHIGAKTIQNGIGMVVRRRRRHRRRVVARILPTAHPTYSRLADVN